MNFPSERLEAVANPRFLAIDEVVGARPDPVATASRLRLHGLWSAGSLEGLRRPCVAIVGSRAPTEGGRRLAERLAHDLGVAGVCTISGLALGIDAAAHTGALTAHAMTIGVLGGGHRHFFPSRNLPLAARIVASGGAVISPYPPDATARPFQFLQRNALVAALADAVLVVEAARRSGALSTASWASDFGVPVLAVPGDVDRAKAAGCNGLIRDGATLVRDADDVLAALGRPLMSVSALTDSSALSLLEEVPFAHEVLAALRDERLDVDTLALAIDVPVSVATSTLVRLEILGVVACDAGRYSLVR